MTFRTKRHPDSSRSRSFPKFDGKNESYFFMHQFLEPLQLLFCLFVIRALTFKLRGKAAFIRLQNLYLALRIRELVKRKRKTFADYVRNREVFERVTREFKHSHKEDVT